MFRFLHTSDLHLGKPFGGYPEDVRGPLRAARLSVIGRLAAQARAGGAQHVLVAGDLFDAENPSPTALRHAMKALAEAADLTWVLLPGNHDSLAATDLWARLAAEHPVNVTLATTPAPLLLAPGVVLLPAPCPVRRPGRDLTDDLPATPEGTLRIGLAHGGVTDFAASEDGNPAIIPPDRAERSGLAYLALGDWHGQMRVGPRQWYSGTPEADSFKHPSHASALLVTLAGTAEVTPMPTGQFHWTAATLYLLPGEDAARHLSDLLPPLPARRSTLLRLTARGRIPPAARLALEQAFAAAAPDFHHADLETAALHSQHSPTDLDAIAPNGALRAAAEALLAETENPALPPEARAAAAAALDHLYAFASAAP